MAAIRPVHFQRLIRALEQDGFRFDRTLLTLTGEIDTGAFGSLTKEVEGRSHEEARQRTSRQ